MEKKIQVGRVTVVWEDGTSFTAENVRGAAVDIEPEYAPPAEIRTGDGRTLPYPDPRLVGFTVRVSGTVEPGPGCLRYEYPESGPKL